MLCLFLSMWAQFAITEHALLLPTFRSSLLSHLFLCNFFRAKLCKAQMEVVWLERRETANAHLPEGACTFFRASGPHIKNYMTRQG